MKQRTGGRRSKCTAVTWTLLAAVTAACIAVGSCALWLPDRTPTLLSSAGEKAVAPASVQEYAGTQQVTVVPTISSDRDLSGNASGMVTADWSGDGLISGKGAYQVNDRTVVALNTATPLYRDLKTGDTGGDVLALNNELDLLGSNSVPGSDTYGWATSLSLADTLWIPEHEVAVAEWNATAGSMVTGGTAIGKIPGSLTKLTIKNGTASAQERSLTIFGITGTLSANTTEITDDGFLRQVEANDSYQSVDVESRKAGFDATLALSERMRVLRVPAGAVFGINGSTGCIVPKSNNHGNTSVKVSIVGGELGVSLVQADSEDIASISNVEIGSGLNNFTCE